jgi:type II secretory pathway component PulF
MGGELPAPTAALVRLGPWLAVLLLVVDALIFWGFYRLARKYWVGLLFAPLFVVGFVTGLVVLAMYLPLFQVVALVRP